MPAKELIDIGKRIRTARTTLNLQQKDVAEALGVSASHFSEVESGKANASSEFHFKLSSLYNISVEYIFHGRGKMFYDADLKLTEEEYDFTTDVDTLDKLIWLLKNSPYFKVAMLFQATKFTHMEEDLIKSSIEKHKNK